MSGFYIHIPFCKQACHYCNFFFSTGVQRMNEVLDAIKYEVKIRAREWENIEFKTLYFGGGTPSLLDEKSLRAIIDLAHESYSLSPNVEITLEANPDDLSVSYLKMLLSAGISRLSIGVQSFYDQELQAMNRSHSASQAESCIKRAQDIGLTELSIDLIYGIPGQSDEAWIRNLNTAKALEVKHISAYALTVEENTSLYHLIRKKKVLHVSDEAANQHFALLRSKMKEWTWDAYEVSNYCLPGHRSKHNSAYWKGLPYAGFGPGAHSFDGNKIRRFNIPSLLTYVKGQRGECSWYEEENLTEENVFNECVMTSLRCVEGLNLKMVEERFGKDSVEEIRMSLESITPEHFILEENQLTLTEQGYFFADGIASSFFKI